MTYPNLSRSRDRRAFLKGMAQLGGAALLAGCADGTPGEPVTEAPSDTTAVVGSLAERPGVQLYTVRDQLQSDFEATMRRVAQIGYREVEFAGYYDRTPEQIRQLLDELQLAAPSTHVGIDLFRADLDGLLAGAATMGHRWVVIPALPELFSGGGPMTADQWRAYAAEFNRFGAAARERGLRFGYHNHWQEYEALGNGLTGMDILLSETDPELVAFELDLCWAVVAERDPVQLFARDPGRYPLWHVKDVAGLAEGRQAVSEQGTGAIGEIFNARQVPVGEGEIDFAAIFGQAEAAGLEHYFVELDQPQDSMSAIETSHRNLRQIVA